MERNGYPFLFLFFPSCNLRERLMTEGWNGMRRPVSLRATPMRISGKKYRLFEENKLIVIP